jgi:predicted PhzF superfamily epimerase YddE/YHI9
MPMVEHRRTCTFRALASYVASQRTVLGRAGRVHTNLEDDQVSVGGDTHTIVRGSVALCLIRLAWQSPSA